MDTIIIFTNKQRIYNLQRYRLSWTPDNNPPKKIPISDNAVFIVAWDAIPDFTDLVKLVNESANVYILHHTQPYKDNLEQLKISLEGKKCHLKKPVQKQHNDEEYIKIQEIDACVKEENGYSFEKPNIQKLQEIFTWYLGRLGPNDKLEAALEFLHGCLTRKPEIIKLKNAGFIVDIYFTDTINKLNEHLDEKYRNKVLESVRDKVLEMAGVK